MSSSSQSSHKIEQIIGEIEEYINDCKYQTFSKVNIIVKKDCIDELLADLKKSTPEEIRRYQKIISNKEAIINDAKQKAEKLLNDAAVQTNNLINEHEIMQQAYAQANEIVYDATQRAQGILDKATSDANDIRDAAMQYLDEMLANLEELMTAMLETTNVHYESFYNKINSYNNVVKANRAEMHPESADITDTVLGLESTGTNDQEDI